MMKNILVCLFLFVSFNAFSQSIPIIEMSPKDRTKGDLKLSGLVESIEYIPLETKDNCLVSVGYFQRFDISENYILIWCGQTEVVYLFKRNGKFVCQVGQRGQGPAEYIHAGNLYIDEAKGELIVVDRRKTLFFTLQGKHIKSISTPIHDDYHLEYFDNQFVTGLASGMLKDIDTCTYRIWDRNFKLVKEGVKYVPVSPVGSWASGRIVFATFGVPMVSYRYKGRPHLRESALNDTLYMIDNKNNIVPKYIIDLGKHKVTPEMKADRDLWNKVLYDGSVVGIVSILETESYLLPYYDFNGFSYYNKQSKKLLYFDSKTGIPDDYAGGIDFWPKKQINNLWCRFYNAPELQEAYEKQKKITPKGDAKTIQKVKSILKKLDSEDNPVLIIAKIKE